MPFLAENKKYEKTESQFEIPFLIYYTFRVLAVASASSKVLPPYINL